jgi:hypothetical protein
MNVQQPEALRLAKELVLVHQGHADEGPSTFSEAAAELRRLYELAQEQHTEKYGLRLEVRNLVEALQRLRKMCTPELSHQEALMCRVIDAAIAKATTT